MIHLRLRHIYEYRRVCVLNVVAPCRQFEERRRAISLRLTAIRHEQKADAAQLQAIAAAPPASAADDTDEGAGGGAAEEAPVEDGITIKMIAKDASKFPALQIQVPKVRVTRAMVTVELGHSLRLQHTTHRDGCAGGDCPSCLRSFCFQV